MPETVDVNELFKDYNILLGGYGPSIEYEPLSENESILLDKFVSEVSDVLEPISPYVVKLFNRNKKLIELIGGIFKAKVRKPLGGELPSSNNFGVSLLIPYDIHYVDTPSAEKPAYTAYGKTSWVLSVTAGTVVHLLGDGSNFFKMDPTTGSRAVGIIFQNGLIEFGTTPSFNQFQVKTEKVNYAPFRAHTFTDVKIDNYRNLYVYRTPFAIPLWYDFGIMLDAMPVKTGNSDLRLFGVVFYEYGHHSSLVS